MQRKWCLWAPYQFLTSRQRMRLQLSPDQSTVQVRHRRSVGILWKKRPGSYLRGKVHCKHERWWWCLPTASCRIPKLSSGNSCQSHHDKSTSPKATQSHPPASSKLQPVYAQWSSPPVACTWCTLWEHFRSCAWTTHWSCIWWWFLPEKAHAKPVDWCCWSIPSYPCWSWFYYVSQNRTAVGKRLSKDVYYQDCINNDNKILNLLDHPTRIFQLGRYSAHMNHLWLVMATFPLCTHGMHADDVARKDRQEWEVVQCLKFLSMQTCLLGIAQGNNGVTKDVSVYGTWVFLYAAWHYTEIFFSLHASLHEGIKYAAFVAIFFSFFFFWSTQFYLQDKHLHYLQHLSLLYVYTYTMLTLLILVLLTTQ